MEIFAALFQRAVLVLGVAVLAVICAAGVCLGLRNTGFFRRARWLLHAFLHPSSAVGWLCVVPLALALIVMGSEKFGGGGGTNDPPPCLSAPRRILRQLLDNAVTSDDVARGYRIAESSGTDGIAGMPEGAATNEPLRRRGGFDWAFRVAPDGWRFPYRDGFLDGVTVLARGEVRPDVGTLYFPVPITNGVSLLPEARWNLLPDGEASVFSHAVTAEGSLLLDWRNALVGRDPNCPTNLQMELFRDGSFAWRTDGGSRFYLPVFPFDWDGDGLENSVDPDPLVANSADAHGTNPEWHGIVCSNVFENAGGAVRFREDVNSNAYYFAEVVAEEGPAPIRFDADRDSRLGSPVVVAQPGETNRVPLLIGVEYAVTSTVPISVSVPDSMYAVVTTNGLRSATVRWPLEFAFEEGVGASNRTYTARVGPYDPGGEFVWDGAQHGGGAMLMSASPNPSCACYTALGNTVTYSCSSTCSCGGDCAATGSYRLEAAMFSVTGGVCRCGFDDPPPPEEPHYDPLDGPGFSIGFSKSAVIFEDTYQDTPGYWCPKRSTRVVISVSAYGGPHGGHFSISTANLEKLSPVGCGPLVIPQSKNLDPGESFYVSFVCEGQDASGQKDDVEIDGSFIENETHETIDSAAKLTVVRIELSPIVDAPENSARGRHSLGVCEYLEHKQHPLEPAITWTPIGGGSNMIYNAKSCYRCPIRSFSNPLRCELSSVSYTPAIKVLEPQGIQTSNVRLRTYGVANGHAGGVGLLQHYVVVPQTVSFSQIAVEEVPCDRGSVSGYFRYALSSNLWTHTRSAKAGQWADVDAQNSVGGSLGEDEAAITEELLPMTSEGVVTNDVSVGWISGEMAWEIPFGWNDHGTSGMVGPIEEFATDTLQEFMIDSSGACGVRKFHNQVKRKIDNKLYLNGLEVTGN